MSVLVVGRFAGDTAQFRAFLESGADRMRRMGETARAAGCLHHRFGVGDGFVMVMDEWESVEAFQRFFAETPELEALIGDAGAQGEPDMTFTEAVASADEF